MNEKSSTLDSLIYNKEYLQTKLREFSEALKTNAADVLSDDFTVLPKIKDVVAKRVQWRKTDAN